MNQFDNIAAFIFGSLAPFNLSYERRYQTVGTAICVFMLLYGCFSIYSSIDRPKFLSSMGFFVQLKYGIDCIISGILSNIDIWTSISALLSYSMTSFLHKGFSIIITFICFSNYFLYTRDRIISPSSTGTTKISSNGAALSALRCGIAMNMKQVKSIEFLKENHVDYEFRTTLVNEFFNEESIEEMGTILNGAKRLFLQQFINGENCIDSKSLTSVPIKKANIYKDILKKYVNDVSLRGYEN